MRRWFVYFFLLGKYVWLSGLMFFCDTRAASFALFVVDYILMFYQEDGGMVRDILFT